MHYPPMAFYRAIPMRHIADSLEMRRMIKAAQELSEIIFIALTKDSKK